MDIPNNKPVKIEIKPKNGLSGKVNLKIYDINNRGSATILITKPSGSDVAHVMNLGLKVVKYLLDNFISGYLQDEDIEALKKMPVKKIDVIVNQCGVCDKTFPSMHGLKLHTARIHKCYINTGSLFTRNVFYLLQRRGSIVTVIHPRI